MGIPSVDGSSKVSAWVEKVSGLGVLYFWASFHEACAAGGQMDQVTSLLQQRYDGSVVFAKVNAEAAMESAERYGVSMVPAFVIIRRGAKVDLIEGANPASLQSALERHLSDAKNEIGAANTKPSENDAESAKARVSRVLSASHLVLLMRGSPSEPLDEASRNTAQILGQLGLRFATFDVSSDAGVTAELRYSSPQLYASGKLVGDSTKVAELAQQQQGQALKALVAESAKDSAYPPPAAAATPAPAGSAAPDLRALINRSPVMLFMKGSPEEPKCGFSRKIVGLLQAANIRFDSFNILEDNAVREGLKAFSNWPTYPQLYHKGELIGGLDIVQEMADEGDLAEQLGIVPIEKHLSELVRRAPVMLFMKGTPQEPRCGFSRQIVQLLREENVEFDSFNILEDNLVREELKKFSNWPTYPQLYADGTLIGGLDVVKELREEGELQAALKPQASAL